MVVRGGCCWLGTVVRGWVIVVRDGGLPFVSGGWSFSVGGWSYAVGDGGIVVCGRLGVWGRRLCGAWSSVRGHSRLCVGCGCPWGVRCRPWVGHGRP